MWKWLRNIVLLAIVLAGALKLAAWYAVGQDAQRVVTALVPYAQIKFDGISAGLDGSVTLSRVSVAPTGAHRIYHADSVAFDSPGLFWLIKHALLHENALPTQFGVSIAGLSLPPEPWLDPLWLDPRSLALFPSAGCESSLGAADWSRMGLDQPVAQARFEYHHDTRQHTLVATLKLSTPGIATLAMETDLSDFDQTKMMLPGFWSRTRVDQLSTTYTDAGFMRLRNAYCAKRENLTPAQFADRHVAAALALLQRAQIVPGDEVVKLYRNLLDHGGEVRLLSLPNAVFSFAAWTTTAPADLLRQLNVTARYQDTPPIMLRLAFAPPPDQTNAADAPPASTSAALNPVAATTPAAPSTAAVAPKIAAPPLPIASAVAKPVSVPAPVPARAQPEQPRGLPTNYLDRAEAKLKPQPSVPPPSATREETTTPPTVSTAPSARVPSNATEALIWQPGLIEELPRVEPPKKDYTVVPFSSLPQLAGHHVRLITLGGKRIEGYVVSADGAAVQLRIDRDGGDAVITVSGDRIVQVQLPHW